MSNSKPELAKATHPLDQPVDEQTVRDLYAAGLISPAARDAGLASLRVDPHWWRWANRSLLFVGAALVLAGIVFFFAYNWARMPAVAKFCLIETGLWICAFGAWRRGLEATSGKVLLLSASMLVGVLLAVYGQVYQTGADAFEIYVLWAGLIFLWVLIARFAALWILWLVVTNVAAILCWIQVDAPQDFDFYFGIFSILAVWNGLALAAREYGAARGLAWLAGSWTRHVIWFSVVAYLTVPAIAFAVGEMGHGELVGAIGLALTLAGGYVYFRHRAPDTAALGFGILSLAIVVLAFIGKWLFELTDGAIAFLVFGLIVLVISSAAAFYLRRVASILGSAGEPD